MFKSHPSNSSPSQSKKHRRTEELIDLERCTQITYDDRLFIRERIKEGNKELQQYFLMFRKERCLSQLQVALRIYLKENRKRRSSKEDGKKIARKGSGISSHRQSVNSNGERSSSRHKMIKIDITELRRSLEKGGSSFAGSLSPRSKIPSPKMSLQLDRKKGQMGRKTSAATLTARDRGQVYIEQNHTLPEMDYCQESAQKSTFFERSPKPSFLNEICQSQEIDALLRSKLGKRRNSRSSKTKTSKRHDPIIKGQALFSVDEVNKENKDHHNRPKTERGVELDDPRFGQFHKKIRHIIQQ